MKLIWRDPSIEDIRAGRDSIGRDFDYFAADFMGGAHMGFPGRVPNHPDVLLPSPPSLVARFLPVGNCGRELQNPFLPVGNWRIFSLTTCLACVLG